MYTAEAPSDATALLLALLARDGAAGPLWRRQAGSEPDPWDLDRERADPRPAEPAAGRSAH